MLLDDDKDVLKNIHEQMIKNIKSFMNNSEYCRISESKLPKGEKPYIIRKDYTIDLNCPIEIYVNIPGNIRFNNTKYGFSFYDSRVTSLKGCPNRVGGQLFVKSTSVENLEGLGSFAHDMYVEYNESLKTLRGCPKKIKERIEIFHNPLLSDITGICETAKEVRFYANGTIVEDYKSNFFNGTFNPIKPKQLKQHIRGLKKLTYEFPNSTEIDKYYYHHSDFKGRFDKNGKVPAYTTRTVKF